MRDRVSWRKRRGRGGRKFWWELRSFRDVSVEDALKKEMIAVELLTNGALDWGSLGGGKTQGNKGNINS